ncbi:MAG: PEP/pyruvate-binding domain-containing protein [Oligoflexia bacterium]
MGAAGEFQKRTASGSVDPIEAMLSDAIVSGDFVPEAVVGRRLGLGVFGALSGNLAGYPFVKVVVERGAPGRDPVLHVLNHAVYPLHAHYVAERLLKRSAQDVERSIDAFNYSVYSAPDRNYFLGVVSLHRRNGRRFFVLETVEVDTMDGSMVLEFFRFLERQIEPSIPLLFKPANHLQEKSVAEIDPRDLPRIHQHELFSSSSFVALNAGTVKGRIRAFRSLDEYREAAATLEWHDIVVMEKVPDDIPRVSGIINAEHTTPLSHTNVLASGWGAPNCIQIGIFEKIAREGLDNQWVEYSVVPQNTEAGLARIEKPFEILRPAWSVQRIKLEEPEAVNTKIQELSRLRVSDRYRYGTKAANLGELKNVIEHGSGQGIERLLGFYRVSRPPRENLLPYLVRFLCPALGIEDSADLAADVSRFLRERLAVPRGIAIPFSIQQEFLESSPRLQQAIGKLKMAIELNAREVDSLCLALQQLILKTRMPESVRGYIDSQIAAHLAGVSSFVVRSSSNAEDLEGFSAAGIYSSINHLTSAQTIFDSIKQVWASMLSPRSVRLRNDVGISLDDCYMGVVVQEQIPSGPSTMGGVLVTANPLAGPGDFRNVYINASLESVNSVVDGSAQPFQYLFNTVEGGGRTLSLGSAQQDLPVHQKERLAQLAFAGRLLQGHFSPDYTFSQPVDIEWMMDESRIYLLQIRPYSTGPQRSVSGR